jgi:methionine synthase I (cobalamin-dependent)
MALSEWLAGGPLLTDGGWGTELQARGLGLGECPDGMNLTRPDLVEQVARAYVDAGSRVILTNTFRGNRISLAGYGLEGKAAEINRAGAEISKRAAAGKALVFASIGPTGKMLMTGEVSEDEILAAFAEQAEALAKGGADALVVETMADLAEAAAALAGAKRTGLPVVVSFVFDSGKNKDRTMMGATPEQVALEMEALGADAIGANCGLGIEGYVPVAGRLRASAKLPVWIKANAGLPEMEGDKVVYRTTPEEFAGYVPSLIEAGVNFIGGCCGTSPAFIRAAAERFPGR